ncbi:MAG: DUF1707 domain-containing protein [Pseudonocardia sp.]|nr:DUF1707 domain-containing protein [Pseudonocardia sp.]
MSEQQLIVTASAAQRIGDVERERAAGLLGEHVGAGRLELSEFERRVRSVYAARTRGELDAQLADLPGARTRPSPDGPRRDPRRARRARRIAMTATWAPWLASTVICLLIWGMIALAQGTPGYFWPVWVFGPWGVMLLLGTVAGTGRAPDPS